jgi:branched-chain amino acid transport system ATP-binding protein
MSVVFGLADRISVLVYGQIIASGTPRGNPRQSQGQGSLSRRGSGMMLEVADLHAYYGKSHILQGVDMHIATPGEVVSLLGRNGVGRSTTVKAIMGEVPPQGSIRFKGGTSPGCRATEIAHRGIGYVPGASRHLSGLTVRQNLMLGIKDTGKNAASGDSSDMLGDVSERLAGGPKTPAGAMSGGEQADADDLPHPDGRPRSCHDRRADRGAGAQMIEQQVGDLIAKSRRHVAILLVEQKLSIAMRISHRVYVMGHGRIVFEGTPSELAADAAVREAWLEV